MEIDGTPAGIPSAAERSQVPSVSRPFFGLLVPGFPVITEFQHVGPNKFACQVPAGAEQVGFFFMPSPEPMPKLGVVLFCSPNNRDWSMLGVISSNTPSALLRTGWRQKPAFASARQVIIGVSVESVDHAENLARGSAESGGPEAQGSAVPAMAVGIAKHVTSFVSSFDTIPPDVMDRWYKSFMRRYERDNTFFLKGGRGL